MTDAEKKLLLIDLCSRLPYGVIVSYQVGKNAPVNRVLTGKALDELARGSYVDEWLKCSFKPYLRPLDTMTEEEIEEYRNLSDEVTGSYGPYHHEFSVHCVRLGIKPDNPHECVDDFLNMEAVDWLNEHHFDYRGLIERGLALEAPKGIYKNY